MLATRYPVTIHITEEMINKIDRPVDPSLLSSRAGRGAEVHYVKGDIVSDALNEVFGPLGWGTEATIFQIDDWEEEKEIKNGNDGYRRANMHVVQVISDVVLKIKPVTPGGSETIFKQPGIGYGEIEVGKHRKEAIGMAVKGAATDGLKRCANMLGKRFGMMMASNGSQEDIEYAHNGNKQNLRKAYEKRRKAQLDERGPQPEREVAQARQARDDGRRDDQHQEQHEPKRRPDNDRATRGSNDQRGSGSDNQRDNGNRSKAGRAQADGKRVARTDYDLNNLPVNEDEMTDFAATLAACVKEMRQHTDRTALVRQHLKTIKDLDPRIRRRLVDVLHDVDVDIDQIRA